MELLTVFRSPPRAGGVVLSFGLGPNIEVRLHRLTNTFQRGHRVLCQHMKRSRGLGLSDVSGLPVHRRVRGCQYRCLVASLECTVEAPSPQLPVEPKATRGKVQFKGKEL